MRLALAASSVALALSAFAAITPDVPTILADQEELTRARPNDPDVWNDYGNLLAFAGQEAAAEAAYRRALEVDASGVAPRFNLALLLREEGRRAEALETFLEVVEIAPRHARSHYQIGAILEAQGRTKGAIDRYARAFALDPHLSFAENNPHVIESELTTDGLVLAGKYLESSASTAPRTWEDWSRLRRRFKKDLEEDLVEDEPSTAIAPRGDGSEASREDLGGLASPTRFDGSSAEGRGAQESGEGIEKAEGDSRSSESGGVGSAYVAVGRDDSGASGTAEPSRSDRTRTDRSGVVSRGSDRSGTSSGRDEATGSVPRVAPPLAAPPTFRPSSRSTGSLDLRLVPLPGPSGDVRAG